MEMLRNATFCLFVLFLGGAAVVSAQENPSVPPVKSTIPEDRSEVRVAILGDSSTPKRGSQGFNSEVLGKLLDYIKRGKADAVFFTGNLASGLAKSEANATYAYSSDFYRKQIGDFHALVKKKLGTTPFYPIVGEQDVAGPEAMSIFRDEFNLGKAVAIDHGLLVYSVAIGNAYFIMLQTDYYDTRLGRVVNSDITSDWLNWLDSDLKEKSSYYPYIFVFGHSPAFSPGATMGRPDGLDRKPEMRDEFWRILRSHNVLAYFSGQENFFDRSLRQDVWQVISGGAGSPLSENDKNKIFYHYLLLTIPQGKEGVPIVTVIDLGGTAPDSFPLNRTPPTIYQLRISAGEVQ